MATATKWETLTEYHVNLSDTMTTDMVTMVSTRKRIWWVENRIESIGPFYREREAIEFCERANRIQPDGKRVGNHMMIYFDRVQP